MIAGYDSDGVIRCHGVCLPQLYQPFLTLASLLAFLPLFPLTRTSMFVLNYVSGVDCDRCVHDCPSVGPMLNGTLPTFVWLYYLFIDFLHPFSRGWFLGLNLQVVSGEGAVSCSFVAELTLKPIPAVRCAAEFNAPHNFLEHQIALPLPVRPQVPTQQVPTPSNLWGTSDKGNSLLVMYLSHTPIYVFISTLCMLHWERSEEWARFCTKDGPGQKRVNSRVQ